ncbi:hypothetical protein K443DRAFT_97233 [Laccaria amethystina LaAM-08-1]|uniref:Uncharacterized protein n=1 Tax=Laccaria amethystina LaAM-08-1 TaxID=1095629 RepID=A0A0C9XBD5_9AGAR|nr:hypothetical protein K443DRAFT_97233 [Laccaria amethystina LaAM-08-1]
MSSSTTDPLLHTYGSPDVFGRHHYNDGNTIFETYERSEDGEIMAYDALSIAELNEEYTLPNNCPLPLSPSISPGQGIPRRIIVTSPNADWMPYISLRARDVRAREDGRFGWADFTVCPQWFIESQWHLPFIRTRPTAATIQSHELSFCWWDLRDHHFVESRGSAFRDLGTLQSDVADALRGEAKKLHLACRSVQQHKDPGRLFYLANKTIDAALQLKFCNFTRRDLVYRVACFQRLYLETFAMYEWHTKWAFRLNDTTGQIYEIDESIMGAITDSPDCIAVLYRVGAPAWYVWPPANIPHDMTIRYIVAPGWEKKPNYRGRSASEYDPQEFTSRDYPNAPFKTVITASPRSSAYVAACQQWCEGHFGPIVSQPIVKEPVDRLATVALMPRPVGLKGSVTAPVRSEFS